MLVSLSAFLWRNSTAAFLLLPFNIFRKFHASHCQTCSDTPLVQHNPCVSDSSGIIGQLECKYFPFAPGGWLVVILTGRLLPRRPTEPRHLFVAFIHQVISTCWPYFLYCVYSAKRLRCLKCFLSTSSDIRLMCCIPQKIPLNLTCYKLLWK